MWNKQRAVENVSVQNFTIMYLYIFFNWKVEHKFAWNTLFLNIHQEKKIDNVMIGGETFGFFLLLKEVTLNLW